MWVPGQGILKAKANDKAEAHVVHCSRSDVCPVYARGECLALRFWRSCKFGRHVVYKGYTRRAKKYWTWVGDQKAQYKDVPNLSADNSGRMVEIDGWMFLPYLHLEHAVTGKRPSMRGQEWWPKEEFTVDFVVRALEAVPRYWGHETTDWQEKYAPMMLKHLMEEYPQMAQEAAERSEHIRNMIASITHVGRKAYLKTLAPNVGEWVNEWKSGGRDVWRWDGTHMVQVEGTMTVIGMSSVKGTIRIEADEEAVVVVTDDRQVTKDTVFVN
jgi:hypothetical protein